MRVIVNRPDLAPKELRKTVLYKVTRAFNKNPELEGRFFEELTEHFDGYEMCPDGGRAECEAILKLAGFASSRIDDWWRRFLEWRNYDGEDS